MNRTLITRRLAARLDAQVLWKAALLGAFAMITGCVATGPSAPPARVVRPLPGEAQSIGNEIVLRAMAQLGRAYRYGGADLEGFDCSGLVYFIHQELGLAVPRTAHQQFESASRVAREALAPGDLVFFRFAGPKISHVGIYAGEGRFIHAPQTGRNVELRRLDDAYYVRHFAGAGRLKS